MGDAVSQPDFVTPAFPPRAVVWLTLALLASLLIYPLHQRYLFPEQDVPIVAAQYELVRRDVHPTLLVYPSALTNLLRAGDEILFGVGRMAGWYASRVDVANAWANAPWRFRWPSRVLSIGAGVASLWAVWALAELIVPGWMALAAPVLLGTRLMFVREMHHGMYDAPASGAAIVALLWLARWMMTAELRALLSGAALAAVAVGFKYNLGVLAVAVLVAAVAAPCVSRPAAVARATLTGVAAMVVAMPELALDPLRVWRALSTLGPQQLDVLAQAAPPGGHGLLQALRLGCGVVLCSAAVGGLVRAGWRRERGVLPLAVFVLAYAVVLARTPLVVNRYALPLAAPLAVLATYGIAGLPSIGLRVAAVVIIAGVSLPDCIAYDRLLGIEDTRVTAATWLAAHAGERAIVVSPSVVAMAYSGPDLPGSIRFVRAPGAEGGVVVQAGAHPVRSFQPAGGVDADAARLLPYAGALVVTSEHHAPNFERASTPASDLALLARHARLVLDLPIERTRTSDRIYEPFDLNYMPFSGFDTLLRPGPHLKIWDVPATLATDH